MLSELHVTSQLHLVSSLMTATRAGGSTSISSRDNSLMCSDVSDRAESQIH